MRLGRQFPIARLALHVVTRCRKELTRPGDSRRTRGRAEALVGPLMLIDQLAYRFVFRLGRREVHAAVVRQREQHRCARFAAACDERLQPRLGCQIEQRGRRHERAPGKQAGVEHGVLQIQALGRPCLRRATEQTLIAIDKHPALRQGQFARQISHVRPGAGPKIEDVDGAIARKDLGDGACEPRRTRRGVDRLAQRQPVGGEVTHRAPRLSARPPSSSTRSPSSAADHAPVRRPPQDVDGSQNRPAPSPSHQQAPRHRPPERSRRLRRRQAPGMAPTGVLMIGRPWASASATTIPYPSYSVARTNRSER